MIDKLRNELYKIIKDNNNLTDPEVVKKSQELDLQIVQAMKGGK